MGWAETGLIDRKICFGVCTVGDISRVAAVVQLVTRRGDTIYGECIQTAFPSLQKDLRKLRALRTATSDSRKRGRAAGY